MRGRRSQTRLEGIPKFPGRLIAVFLRIFERLAQNLGEFSRQQVESDDLRASPRCHLVDRGGMAPEVAAVVYEGCIPPLLQRHEVGRAEYRSGHRLAMIAGL